MNASGDINNKTLFALGVVSSSKESIARRQLLYVVTAAWVRLWQCAPRSE
jgi:hypothetical protein